MEEVSKTSDHSNEKGVCGDVGDKGEEENEEENMADFLILFEPGSSSSAVKTSSTALPPRLASNPISLQKLRRKHESMSPDSTLSGNSRIDPALPSRKRAKTTSQPPHDSVKHAPLPSQCGVSSQCQEKRWTEKAVEKILASQTDPIGKFLRDVGLSAADAIRLNIMPHLDMAPRKTRTVYGKRQNLQDEDKKARSRERNKAHARCTRQRRKVFEVVLDQQLRKLGTHICAAFSNEQTTLYLNRRNKRVENLVGVFSLLDTKSAAVGQSHAGKVFMSRDVTVSMQLQSAVCVEENQFPPRVPIQIPVPGWPNGGTVPVFDLRNSNKDNSHMSDERTIISDPLAEGVLGAQYSVGLPSVHSVPSSGLFYNHGLVVPVTTSVPDCLSSSRPLATPLSLLNIPPSPSRMKAATLPVTVSFRGFEALDMMIERILEALQRAVYRILVCDSFYRKVFDLIVPGAGSYSAIGRTPSDNAECVGADKMEMDENGTSHSTSPFATPTRFQSTRTVEERVSPTSSNEHQERELMSQEDAASSSVPTDTSRCGNDLLCYPISLKSPNNTQEGRCDESHHPSEGDSCQINGDAKGHSNCDTGSTPNSESAIAGSVASEGPSQNAYMICNPPHFDLTHLIPCDVKLAISSSTNDLLVQGTRAMCTFDIEVKSKLPENSHNEASGSSTGSEAEGHDRRVTSATTTDNITCTKVNVPGSLACFSFDTSGSGGSRVVEASFDLDVNAVAMKFLDHTQLLQEYYESVLNEKDGSYQGGASCR
jgi:hypothetical protein